MEQFNEYYQNQKINLIRILTITLYLGEIKQSRQLFTKLVERIQTQIEKAKMINSFSGTLNNKNKMSMKQKQDIYISQQDNIKKNELMSPVNSGQNQSKLKEAAQILQSLNGGVVSKNNEQFSTILKIHNVDRQTNYFTSTNYEQQQIQQQLMNMNSSFQNQQNYYGQGMFVRAQQDNQLSKVYRNINELNQKEQIQHQYAHQNVQSSQNKQNFDRTQFNQVKTNSNSLSYGKQSNGLNSFEQKNKFNLTSRYRQSLSPQRLFRNMQNNNILSKEGGSFSNTMKKISTKPLQQQQQDEYNYKTNLENTNKIRNIIDLTKENDNFKSTKRHQSVLYQSNLNGQELSYGKSNDQYDSQIDIKSNQGQKIILIAKKIEKQDRDNIPSNSSGIHTYRIQTAQQNNKRNRQIHYAYPSNLIKGSPYQDINQSPSQWYQPINEIGTTQATSNIFTNQQQKQMLINQIGRTYSQYSNHPQSANSGKKPFLLQQKPIQFYQHETGNMDIFKSNQNQGDQLSNKFELQYILNNQSDYNNQMIAQSALQPMSENEIVESHIQNNQNLNFSDFQKSQLQKQTYNQQGQEISTSQISQKYYLPNQNVNGQTNQFIEQNSLIQELNNNFKLGQYNGQSIYYQKNYGQETSPIQNSNSEQFYKYIVNYGNNCKVVKRVMETRENWRAIETHNTAYNFRWCPVSQGVKFDRIGVGMKQLINHLEFHKELTCKFTLVKNMKLYCEQNKINLFNVTPLTFLIDLDDDLCNQQLRKFGKFFFKNMPKNSSVVKKPDNVKKVINEFCKHLKPLMQYPMCDRKEKQNPFSKSKMHESFANGDNYFWFLKPTGTNRGRGIYIFNSLDQLEKYIQDYFVGMEEQLLCNRKKVPALPELNQLNVNIDTRVSPQSQNQNEQLLQSGDIMQTQKIIDENQQKYQFLNQYQLFQQLKQKQTQVRFFKQLYLKHLS